MQQATHKTFYNTHTWIGVLAGILLFVVTFSGFPALFSHELSLWQSPALNGQPATQDISYDRIIASAKQQEFKLENFFIIPAKDHGYAYLVARSPGEEPDLLYLSLNNYQPIDPGSSDMAHLFEHLHTDLHLPQPYGRYLVGLAGMIMLLSIIAGIVIHTKWRKEFVMLRPKRSWRLLLTDQHKLLGLWTLPFSFILAFTGTILGLLGIISPILALAKFDGDVGAATAAVLGPSAVITDEAVAMPSIDELWQQAQSHQSNTDITFIDVSGWQDKGGLIKFGGLHNDKLSNLQSVTYQLADGHQVHELDAVSQGPFQRIFAAVTPLHYVQFGDIALKIVYAITTLALCALIISGNMIWLEKKHVSATKAGLALQRPHMLARLTLGICGGLIVTVAYTLAASQWLQGMEEQHHAEEWTFWLVWLAVILCCLPARNLHRMTRLGLLLTTVGLVATVLGDMVVNQRGIWGGNGIVIGVHLCLLALAIVCGYFSWRLPKATDKSAPNTLATTSSSPDEHENAIQAPTL